jgi:hypothetical protein
VQPRIRSEIAAVQSYFALVGGKRYAQRQLPDRVLESFVQKHHVRRAKSVILKARQCCVAVQVAAAQRGLKIKGHYGSGGRKRFGEKEAKIDTAFQITRDGGAIDVSDSRGASVRAVLISWQQSASAFAIKRNLMTQVHRESAKRKCRITRHELLEVDEII